MKAFLLLLLLAPLIMHEPPRPPDADRPQLVRDTPFQEEEPRRFRTSAELADAYRGEDAGLADLQCSGSATLSEGSVKWMLARVPKNTIVVDLRQESHGILNGAAVEWEAQSNWGEVGRTREQALAQEDQRIKALQGTVSLLDERNPENPPENVTVKTARSEEQLLQQYGLGYARFTITDHVRPSDQEVDRFLQFVDGLQPGTWLHFHCRAGVGRTTTFMTMYDMLRNARQVSFAEIVRRQAALPPNFDILEVKPDAREQYSQDRADFISWFYRFAQERKSGESWSAWLQKQA